MAKSIPDQLSMFPLMTSEASLNATSSPESVGEATPSASPGGQTTGLCGQAHALANRSRSQAKEPVRTIQGICGPTSIASSVPSGPLSSWESRLRDRLATVGSTECVLIWREKVTPAGASIFRLARWTPPTSDSGSIGSLQTCGTPTCHMAKEAGYPAEFTRNTLTLTAEAHIATWPTPNTLDSMGERSKEAWERARKKAGCSNLKDYVPHLHSGPTTSGSPEQMENRGALNPAFPCWLMGYPTEWDDCAPTVTPSSRKSRQK